MLKLRKMACLNHGWREGEIEGFLLIKKRAFLPLKDKNLIF